MPFPQVDDPRLSRNHSWVPVANALELKRGILWAAALQSKLFAEGVEGVVLP
jgi:hypothetical protein